MAHYLRLMAVSFYLSLEQAQVAAEEYDLGDSFAGVNMGKDKWITYCVTRPETGHVEVWAPPQALERCVDEYGVS